jgi:hypothetical protein
MHSARSHEAIRSPETRAEGLRSSFDAQFGLPRGALGRLVGTIMAFENRSANSIVVDRLEIQPDDYLLEVRCGPGVALALSARRARFAVGVDPSEVMVAQARRRCRPPSEPGGWRSPLRTRQRSPMTTSSSRAPSPSTRCTTGHLSTTA